MKKIFGYHLSLSLYNCDPEISKNMQKCYQFLDYLPDLMKIHRQSPPFIFYKEKIGLCGWIPIVESGFSLYSDFSSNCIAVDIYSCQKYDPEKITKFITDFFKAEKTEKRYFLRGEEYIHPTCLLVR